LVGGLIMTEDTKKGALTAFNPNQFVTPQEKLNQIMLQKTLQDQALAKSESPNVTQRQYFKPADFKQLQTKFEDMRKYHRALSKLLRVSPNGTPEMSLVKRAIEKTFEKLQEALNDFTTLWTQNTAGFLGTKDEIKEVYRMLIDESKAILSIANPPSRNQLEIVVIAMNHTLEWLMAQAFPYSAGATANALHPQLAKLEEIQLQSQGMAMAMATNQQSRMGKLKDRMPWNRGKTPYEKDDQSGLAFLPQGGD